MRLGDILVARNLVSLEDIERALARQREEGGRLGDNLVALGLISPDQFNAVIHDTPRAPQDLKETGIMPGNLQALMLKFMYVEQRETPIQLGEGMRLPFGIVKELVDDARRKNLVHALGTDGARGASAILETRYALTERGSAAAYEALSRNLYVGPAPVPHATYYHQILKQRITNEVIDNDAISDCFSDLVIPGSFVRRIGPAINSGRTILLYGPPGNGKTSIATRTADIFEHIVYVPYCVDIDGQIMQVYDSSVHRAAVSEEDTERLSQQSKGLRREEFDQRWVACRRPVVIVGGELSLDMLDLSYSMDAKFYEAPMHVKALNGTFIIDDFGRQLISPEALLNRWIVPMESRIDFFKLHTGKSFQVPFDELVIFSTNLAPDDLMDPAFLRRIPYKIELFEPSKEDYRTTFMAVAEHMGLEYDDKYFNHVVDQLKKNDLHMAYYQPKFICDQIINACKYEGIPPAFTVERVDEALENLYVQIAKKRLKDKAVAPKKPLMMPGARDMSSAPPPPPLPSPSEPLPTASTPPPIGRPGKPTVPKIDALEGVDLDNKTASN